MLRKFRVRLNDQEYIVEMEELTKGSDFPQVQPQAQAPVQAQVEAQAVPQQAVTASEEHVATKESNGSVSKTVGPGETVSAPMPGTILDVHVKVGDTVAESEPVLVLEAMKMENQIVSPKAGVVSSILVQQGQAVDVGEVLFTIE